MGFSKVTAAKASGLGQRHVPTIGVRREVCNKLLKRRVQSSKGTTVRSPCSGAQYPELCRVDRALRAHKSRKVGVRVRPPTLMSDTSAEGNK